MAEQGTEGKTASAGGESASQDASSGESTGRHAANDEVSGNAAAEAQAPSEDPSGTSSKSEQASEQKTEEKSEQASEQKTSDQNPSEQKTEKVETAPQRGQGDTSWAEPEHGASGGSRHRSIDVGELAWRTGNVLATVVRTLALLFTLVLVVNVVLVLVGVNPANGVAQFVGAVADIVILGFRDLFVPANPIIMLIVNSLVAAVFWVFVGELLSRLIRFLAARLN
ncbi:MAG TPA: hypothetical protein VGH76_19270 [Actinomycetospora sp.]|jgi:hypothetical protein|uniref:hypothetical protein n=1 Tax=Actinomycetospora sp. TaxID=1872135 RepID=UPI002F3F9A72